MLSSCCDVACTSCRPLEMAVVQGNLNLAWHLARHRDDCYVEHDTVSRDSLVSIAASNVRGCSKAGEAHACRRRLAKGSRRTLVGQIGRSGKHVIYHGSPSAPRVYSNPRFIIITPDLGTL